MNCIIIYLNILKLLLTNFLAMRGFKVFDPPIVGLVFATNYSL